MRIFNSAFDGVGARSGDYYPQAQRREIDVINATVYDNVNNGVYKAGFTTSQPAINPTRIVPIGPDIDFSPPRDRARLPHPHA